MRSISKTFSSFVFSSDCCSVSFFDDEWMNELTKVICQVDPSFISFFAFKDYLSNIEKSDFKELRKKKWKWSNDMHWKMIMEAIRFKANKRNKPKLSYLVTLSLRWRDYSILLVLFYKHFKTIYRIVLKVHNLSFCRCTKMPRDIKKRLCFIFVKKFWKNYFITGFLYQKSSFFE